MCKDFWPFERSLKLENFSLRRSTSITYRSKQINFHTIFNQLLEFLFTQRDTVKMICDSIKECVCVANVGEVSKSFTSFSAHKSGIKPFLLSNSKILSYPRIKCCSFCVLLNNAWRSAFQVEFTQNFEYFIRLHFHRSIARVFY